jgi:hypothetical protein
MALEGGELPGLGWEKGLRIKWRQVKDIEELGSKKRPQDDIGVGNLGSDRSGKRPG